jgi:hypothetical protein
LVPHECGTKLSFIICSCLMVFFVPESTEYIRLQPPVRFCFVYFFSSFGWACHTYSIKCEARSRKTTNHIGTADQNYWTQRLHVSKHQI